MIQQKEVLTKMHKYLGCILNPVDRISQDDVYDAFLVGENLADSHPKNIWHDASEEPNGDNWEIICVDNFDLFWVESRVNALWKHNNWKEYAEVECVKMWAYIRDLLPKENRRK